MRGWQRRFGGGEVRWIRGAVSPDEEDEGWRVCEVWRSRWKRGVVGAVRHRGRWVGRGGWTGHSERVTINASAIFHQLMRRRLVVEFRGRAVEDLGVACDQVRGWSDLQLARRGRGIKTYGEHATGGMIRDKDQVLDVRRRIPVRLPFLPPRLIVGHTRRTGVVSRKTQRVGGKRQR